MTADADTAAPLAVLIRRIATLYGGSTGAGSELLRQAAGFLSAQDPSRATFATTQRRPACRYLPEALTRGCGAPFAAIASALSHIEARLNWVQNPNYTDATIGAAFLDRYAYAEIAGVAGTLSVPDIAIGFLLLGPDTHYPDHHHPAAEVYHVISGEALWWREEADWQPQPPGAAIYHPPHIRHAMRTGREPLLALYCWGGEVGTAARLT